MLVINERFCVIDGWIVDLEQNQVVSLRFVRDKLTADEMKKLEEIEDLKVFSKIDTKASVIVNVSSDELFRYIKTVDVEFVTLKDRVVAKNSASHNKAKKSVVNHFSLSCHPVVLKGTKKCYLYHRLSNPVSELETSMGEVPVKIKTKDTSVYTRFIKVQNFVFTQDDFDFLVKLATTHNSSIGHVAAEMMKKMYLDASDCCSTFFGRSFHLGVDNFIKNLQFPTLEAYGKRVSFLLLLLKHCDRLSVFSKFEATAKRVASLCRICVTGHQLAVAIGKEMADVSVHNKDAEFWTTWVFLGAFDFKLWNRPSETCPCVSILTYRYLLDSVRWLIRYGGVIHAENKEDVVEKWTSDIHSGEDFVGNVKKLYDAVRKEATVFTATFVNISYEDRYVLVKNRKLSYEIIGAALADMTADFDSYSKELSRWLSFADFNVLHFETIGSSKNLFLEDASKVSILQNFSKNAFVSMRMWWRDERNRDDETVMKQTKDIINKLNKTIMLMVWMSTGMPLRFPELVTITYAGVSRNVFIDVVKRRLYLNIRYNKNQKFTNRVLFMSDGVSRRLWWCITVLRTFMYVTFHNEMCMFDRKVFVDELYNEIRNDMNETETFPEEEEEFNDNVATNNNCVSQAQQNLSCSTDGISSAVMKMFAFVDIKNHRLFDLRQFTNMLKSYPKESLQKEGHTISTWRQGLAALWKYFILPQITTLAVGKVARGFGNSKNTLKGMYGVDARLTEGEELTFVEMATACELFHELIGAAVISKKKVGEESGNDEVENPMDNYDLYDAGNRYFGVSDFNFKSADQKDFTTMVLLGSRKVAGLQAPTAFGKSLTFILPMMVLKTRSKKHYIHFVCVPYESLKVATISKLEKGGLVAREIGLFTRDDLHSSVPSVDVFVGCLESFVDGTVSHVFKNWELSFDEKNKMGYLVFDEAHTLFFESRYRTAVSKIKNMSWVKWRKTLFLSATMGRGLFYRILEDRHIPQVIVQSSLFVNCIKEVPRKKLEANVKKMRYMDVLQETTRLIESFLNNTNNCKAIFFFTNKERLHQAFRTVNMYRTVRMVDSDSVESEKRQIFEDFENEHSDTRVVMGTKLLSNGLDCRCVRFVCLVDCSVNCVDYLQMVGRIRNWGYICVLTAEGRRLVPNNTELTRMYHMIEWGECITKQVARFYDVAFAEHCGCCGSSIGDDNIQRLRSSLDTTVENSNVNGLSGDEDEEEEITQDWLTKALSELLLKAGSGVYIKEWRDILGEYECASTKHLLLGMEPKYVVKWDESLTANFCDDCLMPVHEDTACGPLAKVVGNLVYELLTVEKMVKTQYEYGRLKNELTSKGSFLFLFGMLRRNKNNIKADFIKLNEGLNSVPRHAADMDSCFLDPVRSFVSMFYLIYQRKINVVLLLFKGTVEYSPSWYCNMSMFYSFVFRDKDSINEVIQYDDTALFASFKKDVLADIEAWYREWKSGRGGITF